MIIHSDAPYSKMGTALSSSRPCPKAAPTRIFGHIFLEGCSSRKGISNFKNLMKESLGSSQETSSDLLMMQLSLKYIFLDFHC